MRIRDFAIRRMAVLAVGALALVWLAACGGAANPPPAAAPTPRPTLAPPAAAPTLPPAPTAAAAAMPSATAPAAATPTPAATPSPTPGIAIVLGGGSKARYRVREQLARVNAPTDAVGETPNVSGSIAFSPEGAVQPDRSKITVDLRTLTSDEDRRDNFIRNSSLESSRFPNAVFVVRETPGLSWPLPAEGEATFKLVGDMTLHGVTKPLTWDVTARFSGNSVSGQAKTSFTFKEFGIEKPQLFFIVSVADDIQLEFDFAASITDKG